METVALARRVVWLRRHARLVGLLVFVALAFTWFASVWMDPRHRHAGIVGDPESYLFALAWPPFAVTHHMNPFSTTYLLAPAGADLMWTVPPGFGLLLWPLTATVGLVVTYNLLATLSLAASAWTAQLALRRFVPGELGPFVGGLFYGFSPYMAAHSTAHVMLTVAVLPPLLLALLHEALVRQRWPPALTGLAIGALVAFQLSTFLELVAGGAVAAALLGAVLAVVYRDQIRCRFRYVLVAVAAAGVSFLVLGGYPLWTLLFGARSLLHVHALVHPANVDVTDLVGFVVPSKLSALAPSALKHVSTRYALGSEVDAYVGLPLLVVTVVVAARNWGSATVRIASFMTATMAILSMGPRLHIVNATKIPLPWALVARLPLMGNLLPVRLSVFTDLGIALLVAYAIGHRVRPATRGRVVARCAVVAAVVVTLLPSHYLLSSLSAPVDVPAYFTSTEVRRIPGGSVALVAPWTTDTRNDQPEVWQAFAHFRFRLASGYANVPTGNGGLSTGMHADRLENAVYAIAFGHAQPARLGPGVRDELRRDLKHDLIATVIVGPMSHEATMVRFLTDLLGRPPGRTGGVYVWYGVQSTA